MATYPHQSHMTVEEYFELCSNSPDTRYEYIDGYIVMMSGGTFNHVGIRDNVYSLIRSGLRGRSCRAYTADINVRLSATRYVLPDVVVTCDERDSGENKLMQSPFLVVEVLSPSTEAYDRGNKFLYYRECSTIQEYVLVSSSFPLVEVFRREKNDLWVLTTFKLEDTVQLTTLGISFPVRDVYENIVFPNSEKPTA
jgi:Uma2 family endonuclease